MKKTFFLLLKGENYGATTKEGKKSDCDVRLTVLYKCSTTYHEETRFLFGSSIFSSGTQTNDSDGDGNHHDSS